MACVQNIVEVGGKALKVSPLLRKCDAKEMKPFRVRIYGGALVAVLVLVAILGLGLLGLERRKKAMEEEALAYAMETVEQVLFAHNQTYLSKNVSRTAEREFFASRQEAFVARLVEAGQPARPIKLEGGVKFESYFFNPSGGFRAPLLFAGGPGTLTLNISHPGDKWQIDGIAITWNFSGVR